MRFPRTYILLVAVALMVFGGWYAALLNAGEKLTTETLEPLFTGLGFIAVLATLLYEQEKVAKRENQFLQQFAQRDKEHHELLLKMQVQVKATCHAARIAALTASIENDRAELEKFHLVGVSTTTGSGAMAAKRKAEIEGRLKANEHALRIAAEIAEFL